MRKNFLLCFLVLFITGLYAQSHKSGNARITGKVVDSASGNSLDYATITLYAAGVKRPVNGTTANQGGEFVVSGVAEGTFRLLVECIGYHSQVIPVITVEKKNSLVNLGRIRLSARQEVLKNVTVVSQSKLVETRIDKMVYNAEKDITSQTGVATDILKKVPQISVNIDGSVELQGSTNILFLINGKPSAILGSNITDVLQAIPANQIKSIEVITNPGAKYDAQGIGGIINIILKHNTVEGINGNVSLTAGTIVQNGSFNIDARKGKFGINAFVNGNARLTTTTRTSSYRVSTDTATKTNALLQQNGSSDFNRHGFQSGIGFDWADDDRNSITGALSYHNFGNRAMGFADQTEQTQAYTGGAYSGTNSINNANSAFRQYSFDPGLNYKHSFKNKEQELEIGIDGSFSHNTIHAGNDQYLLPKDSLVYGTRNNNPAKQNEYEMKIDYVQPLRKDINLGVGGKFSGYDISSIADALVWSPYFNAHLYDSALSNDLNYRQRVYAAYTEINFPVGKILEARIGGRYERTQLNAFYANAKQQIENGYNTFIPSIFMMKKIGENQSFRLNFTIRINRPDYSDLNPFINTSDPKNINKGNPNLKPEIWDRYEASYNNNLGRIGSFLITLFYRQSNGDIQPFIIYYPSIQVGDTTYNNVTLTTRENIGVEKNAGTNLFFDFHINDKFNVRSNIIFFFRHTVNRVDIGYNSSSTIYRFNVNASYQFKGNFAAEFFGSFNSHHHEAQGFYPSFTSYSLAFRKLFWNKKGSVALTANNFFSKYINQRTDLYGPGFMSSSLRRVPYQSVGINFTWKFGKLELKKEKSQENAIDLSAPQQ